MPDSVPNAATRNTIVVCDEPNTAQYIGKILARTGYVVRFAWTSDQILPSSATYKPWLLVLAEALLSPDEHQAVDQLFAQGVRVIFLNAHPEEPSGGMRAFPRDRPVTINKPFNPQELVQVARRLRIWWEQDQ